MTVAEASCHARVTGLRAQKRWAQDPEVILMLRVQAGDCGAFARLVDQYWTRVFGRFFRRLGDRQEAEDLTQEVFLRIFRYRDRYRPRAKFTTWLFFVTQNVARNALRSRRRHPSSRLHASNGEEPTGALDRSDPSRALERAEVARVVRRALGELAGRQRTALELHQFHDRSYSEIAREMDMSPKAAKSLLYRARNQLRAILSNAE